MPDDSGGSLWDSIKSFLPAAAGAAVGALAGGGPGALVGAGGVAEAQAQQSQAAGAQQEKLLQILSMAQERQAAIEERKSRDQQMAIFQQGTLEERRDAEKDRAQQNTISDQIRLAGEQEKEAHDREIEALGQGNLGLRQEDIELRAMIAGRNGSKDARYNVAVGQLSALTGKSEGEVRMEMSHNGLSANGALAVATRAQELQKLGKPVDLDTLSAMATKAKNQYGSVLDNLSTAIEDPKNRGARLVALSGGAKGYGNYLVSRAKLWSLPPAERRAAEQKIRQFAAGSVPPKGDAKNFTPPSMDDLATLLDPSEAPDKEETPAAAAATPAAKAAAPAAAAAPSPLIGKPLAKPDGVYRNKTDGKMYVVKDGKIAGIRDTTGAGGGGGPSASAGGSL